MDDSDYLMETKIDYIVYTESILQHSLQFYYWGGIQIAQNLPNVYPGVHILQCVI